MPNLLTFKTYPSATDATEAAETLRQHGIHTEVIKAAQQYTYFVTGGNYNENYVLKIAQDDFSKANELLKSEEPAVIDVVDAHHPLQAMNTDELKAILEKPDEWGSENYGVALAILKSRGITYTQDAITHLKEERINVLSQQKTANPLLLFIGYVMSCLYFFIYLMNYLNMPTRTIQGIFWNFLWALGIILGLVLAGSKTTLPDGSSRPTYTSRSMLHGRLIIILYIISIITRLVHDLLVTSAAF